MIGSSKPEVKEVKANTRHPTLICKCKRCGKLVIFEDSIRIPAVPEGFSCNINEITHWCDSDKKEMGIIELVGYSFS